MHGVLRGQPLQCTGLRSDGDQQLLALLAACWAVILCGATSLVLPMAAAARPTAPSRLFQTCKNHFWLAWARQRQQQCVCLGPSESVQGAPRYKFSECS
jgi:hypothetical protein